MINEEKMLKMVLADPKLSEEYGYDKYDYENIETALDSSNVVVAVVARIIKNITTKGSMSDGEKKTLYLSVFKYLNDNAVI